MMMMSCATFCSPTLTKWGYDVTEARNGLEAWRLLHGNDAPKLAVLDWIMPGDGRG
jgi:CheY-like chemotaxis protein